MKFLLDGGASAATGSGLWMWIIIAVVIVLMFVMTHIRNKKETQARMELNEALKVGTKVITYAGVYGTIVSMKETTDGKVVVIETGDEKHKSYMEIIANAIAAIDKKEMVVLDENGNDITNEAEEEVKEVEEKDEVDELLEQIKDEKSEEVSEKKKSKRKKK